MPGEWSAVPSVSPADRCSFPTRYRSTSHGISAASGKVRRFCRRGKSLTSQFGAIIAQIMAFTLKDRGGTNAWINHLLQIFALFMVRLLRVLSRLTCQLTGLFASFLIPETKGRTLEELSGEDQTDFVKAVPRS